MFRGYKMVRDLVNTNPLPILQMPAHLQAIAEDMLPYSTGFEIECSINYEVNRGNSDIIKVFKAIPDIIDVNIDSSEQRFRIPTGIKGLICLYNICEALKVNSKLNLSSGIHYHIDFTDCFDAARRDMRKNNDWVIKALRSWNYKGTFNTMVCSDHKTAVKYHNYYKTIEFRIGEMSFDYAVLVKRILHCQNISRKIKSSLKSCPPKKVDTKLLKARKDYEIRDVQNDIRIYTNHIASLRARLARIRA